MPSLSLVKPDADSTPLQYSAGTKMDTDYSPTTNCSIFSQSGKRMQAITAVLYWDIIINPLLLLLKSNVSKYLLPEMYILNTEIN